MRLEELKKMAGEGKLKGVFHDIPAEIYHHPECPGISNSKLGWIEEGLNVFLNEIKNPTPPTPDMEFGTAVHDAILLPGEFEKNYIPEISVDRRTKEGKEAWEKFQESAKGKKMVDMEKYKSILEIRKIVKGHPTLKNIMTEGRPEVSFWWTDPQTKILCKGRGDWIREDDLILDFKTTTDIRSNSFSRTIANYSYDRAAAFYLWGYEQASGKKIETFLFVPIQKKPPYDLAIYSLGSESLDVGKKLFRRELNKFKTLLDMNKGSTDFSKFEKRIDNLLIETLDLPLWATRIESR